MAFAAVAGTVLLPAGILRQFKRSGDAEVAEPRVGFRWAVLDSNAIRFLLEKVHDGTTHSCAMCCEKPGIVLSLSAMILPNCAVAGELSGCLTGRAAIFE